MWELGSVGSDPDLLRVDAADLFISYLGVDTGTTGHLVAVVHFGTKAELVVPLTPLESADRRAAVRQAIADPGRMDWTDPLAALALAYDELFNSPRADPSHRPAVVLLSDGKPERSANPEPGEMAAYLADLRALVDRFAERNCPVFTVALTSAATDADPDIQTVYRNLWQEVAARTPPAEYHEARVPEDLLHVYHDVVARLAGAEVKPPLVETKVTGTVAYRVPVKEDLARLTLVILKTEPSVRARVLRPGGLLLRAGDPDVRYAGQPGESREEVWTVTTPRPGDWTVELDGQGHVIVWKDVTPLPVPTPALAYAFDLLAPAAYVPDDAPLLVAAVLRDETGEPLRDLALQITIELRRAGFPEATLLARDDGAQGDKTAADGVFTARYPNPAPGAYTLHLRALRGGEDLARWEGACEVVPLPRLEALSPAQGESASFRPGEPVTAEVRVAAGLSVLDSVALSALGALTATLAGPACGEPFDSPFDLAQDRHCQTAVKARPLNLVAVEDIFCVEMPAPQVAGDYAVSFHLAGHTVEGLAFTDTLSVPFSVLPPPAPVVSPTEPRVVNVVESPTLIATPTLPPTPVPESPEPSPRRSLWPWVLAFGGVKVLGLLGTGYWVVRRRAPRLEGGLRVLESPPGQPSGRFLDLPSHRREVDLDSNGLPLPGARLGAKPPATLRAVRGKEGQVGILLSPASAGPESQETVVTVNGLPLSLPHALQDGDVVAVGGWRLRYENLGQAARCRTQRVPLT